MLNFNLKFYYEPVEKIFNDLIYDLNHNNEIYNFDEKLSFNDIDFNYGSLTIFSKINLSINKTEKILIIGDSGIGKTTLLDVIIGFKKPSNGRILVDGKKLNGSSDWIKKISLVPQQSFLYNETIKFNITFQEDEKKLIKTYNQSLSILV